MQKETHNSLSLGYRKEVQREIRGFEYFDDSYPLFYWKDTLKAINLLKQKKIVNITEIRHLYIGLVAIETTIRERLQA